MQESKQLKYAQNQNKRFDPNFIQIGIVKDTRDPNRSGRIKVWISGSQSAESSKESWITCRYLSAFAGRTQGSSNAQQFNQYAKSYGLWATPPDVGTSVAVFFANGNVHDAYWFGGVFDDRMNAMVPGMATKVVESYGTDSPVPITDYDRNTLQTSMDEKYVNSPVVEGLKKQNLLYDKNYGPVNRSSTRQTVPTVYGLSSPRQNSIVIDDGYAEDELNAPSWDEDDGYQNTSMNNPSDDNRIGSRANEGICLRTRSGAQILLSESTGNVFIINRDGTARIEMTPEGYINIHSDNSMNIRTDQDMNFTIKKDWNVEVGGNMNFHVKGDSKIEMQGTMDTKVLGEVVFNTSSSMRLFASAELRFQSGSNTEITSGAQLNTTSADITNIKGSAVHITGGGTDLTIAGDVSTNAIYRGSDFQSSSVSLNEHIHYHQAFNAPDDHSDAMAPPVQGGSAANPQTAAQAQPANDVVAQVPARNTQEAVAIINTTPQVTQALDQDMLYDDPGSGVTYYQTYESLAMVMPCTGTIRQYGYWGKDVSTETGKATRNGWIIQCKGDVVAPEKGTLGRNNTGFFIAHGNGFKTVYYDVNLELFNGDTVTKGQKIGTANGVFYFEVRLNDAALYGFAGTVDPGLFYSTVTGKGADCANKSLTAGQRSNPNAQPVASSDPSVDSTDLVMISSVQTIGSSYSQRGSRSVPRKVDRKQGKATGKTVNFQINDNISIDKTVVDWKITNQDPQLISDLKAFEGLGNVINGRAYRYIDSEGFPTIGYGHLILPNESFPDGISMEEAEQMLQKDVIKAINDAKKIYASYNMNTPYMIQLVLTEMVYQMGSGGVRKFTGTLGAMARGDYRAAANGMRNSAWYGQTTRRAETLARRVEKCA